MKKSDYRKFIHPDRRWEWTTSASMREVITRRYARIQKEKQKMRADP